MYTHVNHMSKLQRVSAQGTYEFPVLTDRFVKGNGQLYLPVPL